MKKYLSVIIFLAVVVLASCTNKNYDNTAFEKQDDTTDIVQQHNEISNDLIPLQGEWKSLNSDWHLIIHEKTVDALYYKNYGEPVDNENHSVYSIGEKSQDDTYPISQLSEVKYIYFINDDGYLETHTKDNLITNYYEKVSDITSLPQINVKEDPYIGMSSSDLENSTWGTPYKKNKTTSSNGTKEQWVYNKSFNRKAYVYITNGYVTAIQER